ncbi:MAG: hypothetical protein D6834_01195, partial [Aquificota bacterium]
YKNNIYIVCSPKPFSNFYINEKLKPFINEVKLVIDSIIKYEDVLIFREFFKKVPIIFQPENNKEEMFKKARKIQKKLLIEENTEVRIIPQYHKFFKVK